MINFVSISKNDFLINECRSLIDKVLMKWDIYYKFYSISDEKNIIEKLKEISKYKIYLIDASTIKCTEKLTNAIRKIYDDYISFIFIINYNKKELNIEKYDFHTQIVDNETSLNQMLGQGLSHILSMITETKENITFKSEGSIIKIPYIDILYIEKDINSKNCHIICKNNKKYYIKTTITDLEKSLGKCFIKTHRSAIINKCNILQIDFINNKIIFKDGTNCYLLSRSNKKQIKNKLSEKIKKVTN